MERFDRMLASYSERFNMSPLALLFFGTGALLVLFLALQIPPLFIFSLIVGLTLIVRHLRKN